MCKLIFIFVKKTLHYTLSLFLFSIEFYLPSLLHTLFFVGLFVQLCFAAVNMVHIRLFQQTEPNNLDAHKHMMMIVGWEECEKKASQ